MTHHHHALVRSASLSGRGFGEVSVRIRRECSRTVEDGRCFQACTGMCLIGRDAGEGLYDNLALKRFARSAVFEGLDTVRVWVIARGAIDF